MSACAGERGGRQAGVSRVVCESGGASRWVQHREEPRALNCSAVRGRKKPGGDRPASSANISESTPIWKWLAGFKHAMMCSDFFFFFFKSPWLPCRGRVYTSFLGLASQGATHRGLKKQKLILVAPSEAVRTCPDPCLSLWEAQVFPGLQVRLPSPCGQSSPLVRTPVFALGPTLGTSFSFIISVKTLPPNKATFTGPGGFRL